jgi:hypothetical protein
VSSKYLHLSSARRFSNTNWVSPNKIKQGIKYLYPVNEENIDLGLTVQLVEYPKKRGNEAQNPNDLN